jgi:hypothetical protein
MKRVLTTGAVLGIASMALLFATPGDPHKILWCHYPPGQWTGTPDTSKVIILDIDVAATGLEKETNKHIGHSPTFLNEQGQTVFAEGPFDDEDGCPSLSTTPGEG